MENPSEDKDDDMKDGFYEEIERLLDQLPVDHMKTLSTIPTQNYDEIIFSSQQSGSKAYIQKLIITILD